jgi:hypothetical protein
MILRNTTVFALLAAAGSAAPAGNFAWTGGSGLWSDASKWTGPAGLYPSVIADSASVAGNLYSVTLDQNISIGSLNVISGGAVYTSGHSLFVNGDVLVANIGSSLSVSDTPALRDLDLDTLSINTGVVALYGGLLQADEAISIQGSGGILGTGTIEMNSTTGNLVVGDGTIWAVDGSGPSDLLLIRRTESSTSRLDWTSADSTMTVSGAKTLENQLPYSGSLGGDIRVFADDGTATYRSANAIVAGANSSIRLRGLAANSTARIEAPVLDSHGEVRVSSYGVIDAPLIALRGTATLQADGVLSLPADAMIFDSLLVSPDGEGGAIQMGRAGSSLSVIGGATVISLGAGGEFDLDGAGDKVVNIAAGSSLVLDVEKVDIGNFELFSGTLNIDGLLHVEAFGPDDSWASNGEINLDGGEITGRAIVNDGLIAGRGEVNATVLNNGEIAAQGGALFLSSVDLDGNDNPESGVVRAQDGDIVLTAPVTDTAFVFNGVALVGNGSGVAEVFEMNFPLSVAGVGAELHLDAGFVRAKRLNLSGNFTSQGASTLRASGNGPIDSINFMPGGNNSVSGTLELDGDAWAMEGASFQGAGVLRAVSTIKRLFLDNGADLGTVGIDAAGEVFLADLVGVASTASAGSLVLRPTAQLNISIVGDQPVDSDRLVVSGPAILDGTLAPAWYGQGACPIGVTYTILTAGSVAGSFDSIDPTALGANRRAAVQMHPDRVNVLITCLGDLNGDGLLDLSDVTAFVQAFTGNDPIADVAAPFGLLDLGDVTEFVAMFQAGCQ